MAERLVIDHVGARGDGVAAGGEFVAYTLPGEIVRVGPADHADRRTLVDVEQPSPDRAKPVCRHFGVCGGCATQHWASAPYLAWKRDLIVGALRHAGIEAEVDAAVDAHGEGRRRAVFHARGREGAMPDVGFAAPRAHRIVPIEECPVLAPALSRAIEIARALAGVLAAQEKPLDLHFTATDTGLDVDLRGSGPLSPSRAAALSRLAAEHRLARLTRHGELIAQTVAPTLRMGSAHVPLPPGSFLQATRAGEEALARLVLKHAAGVKRIADLFCGVGPFALRLAERASVAAFDSDAGAVEALAKGARTPGLKPVAAAKRDLFRTPMVPQELKGFDAVVFDPPRQGAEAQAKALAASRVKRVVAVSCNAATFARDARILIDGGYRLERVTPVDQFRYSAHVELVASFAR